VTTNNSRPVVSEAAEDQSAERSDDNLPADTDDIAAALRRRRAAAKRLPPLEHLGRGDPWEICPPSSREPLKAFWLELKSRGLITDAITAELLRLANELRRAA
jgi:hypothetical protein